MSSLFIRNMYLYEKQWTKLNSLPPLRSKTHGSLSLSHSFDVTNILSHTGLVYICSETFVCSSSISLSKAGTNEAGRLSLSWGGAIQTAPSRTLWCYFNVGSCNCVEQACFFSSRSNRGQPPLQLSLAGLQRWPWSETCLKFHLLRELHSRNIVGLLEASGFRSQGPLCVKVNNTESGKSLCLGVFLCVFLKLTFGRSTLQHHIQDSDPSEIDCRTSFLPFFVFPHCWKWTALATSEHLWVSEWLFTA